MESRLGASGFLMTLYFAPNNDGQQTPLPFRLLMQH